MTPDRTWCVILATESTPSSAAWSTPMDGQSTPPQFAPGDGSVTPFRATLQRAARIAPGSRTLVVLRRVHRPFWAEDARSIPPTNHILVERDMGSGVAAALATVTILGRDPGALVVFLPAWQLVEDADRFDATVGAALTAAPRENRVVIVALEPDALDLRHVWLIPRAEAVAQGGVDAVCATRNALQVTRCEGRGGLWATSTMVGLLSAWVRLFEAVAPSLVQLLLVLQQRVPRDPWLWDVVLSSVATLDLVMDVGARAPHLLRVVTGPPCGVTDLRVPEQTDDMLARHRMHHAASRAEAPQAAAAQG